MGWKDRLFGNPQKHQVIRDKTTELGEAAKDAALAAQGKKRCRQCNTVFDSSNQTCPSGHYV